MKSIAKLALAGALTCALSATVALPAAATAFTGTYDVAVQSADPGLVLNWNQIAPRLNFNLTNWGDSIGVDLYNLFTDETALNWQDDFAPKPITTTFNFVQPNNLSGQIAGETSGQTAFFGLFQQGQVTWANGGNATFAFDNGMKILAHLDNAVFNTGFLSLDEGPKAGAPIHATFTVSAVPEASTWAMMILGMTMVGAGLRLRRRTAAVAA